MNEHIQPFAGLPVKSRQPHTDYTNGVVVAVLTDESDETEIHAVQVVSDFGNVMTLSINSFHLRYQPTKAYIDMLKTVKEFPDTAEFQHEQFTVERYLTDNFERTKEAYEQWVK